MFCQISLKSDDGQRLLPVTSENEIEHLVKESEVVTGRPGREFVVTGAERLSYRVEWLGVGFSVRRFDGDAPVSDTLFIQRRELTQHTLGKAMRCGLLFTPHTH